MISSLTNPDFTALLEQEKIKQATTIAEQTAYPAARNRLYAEHIQKPINKLSRILRAMCALY
ncbi:MAG TPA: hypothetical protein VEI53_14945 [Ktedonobacteraceae bacterium]|nr:hypothetical protein [Ktedonobacteraceae bacterium]